MRRADSAVAADAFSARAGVWWGPSGKPLYGASWRLIRPSWKALRRPFRLFMSDASARVAAPRQKQAADVPRNALKVASFMRPNRGAAGIALWW
jgi:hypothetical protein